MSEWWTYRPSDFLMFSPTTYRRLFELYNDAFWPWQVLPLLAGMAVLGLLLRRGSAPGRVVMLVLAACWSWVAWAFHAQRYAEINWSAAWFAVAFAVEAMVLVAVALASDVRVAAGSRWTDRFALALVLLALAYPMIGVVSGGELVASEFFGFAPDPTVIGTLAFLALARGRLVGIAHVVPLAWCFLGGITLWTMDFAAAWALAVAGMVSAASLVGRRRERG